MYTPPINAEQDPATLRQFVRANPLCALVTNTPEGLIATHIPMVLHEEGTAFGTLRGHVAHANNQWRDSLLAEQALGIFTGPEHYISASWYTGKATHGKEVPTWNYTAVHVYGTLRIIEDPVWLLEHLRTLTAQSEAITHTDWRVDDAPADFIASLSRAIAGIELPVHRVEGKWKVSQNRSEADAAAVIAGLQSIETPAAATMADLVRTRHPRKP